MLTWLATKTAFQKTWTWLKHNWYVPAVILYTLILWLLFRQKDKAHEVLKIRSESYKKQIDAINEIHEEEIKKKDKILEKYGNILNQLEEKYKEDSLELNDKKKKEIKKLVEDFNEKPDELARLLADRYGLEYVE